MSSLVLTSEQVRCLSSKGRAKVLGAFRTLGASSIKEVASAAGLSIETTHYHVRLMAECGLLKPAGSRSSGKRPMTIYEPTEKRFVFPTASDAQDRLHSAKAMRAFVEIAASEFQSGGTALETRPYISRLYLSVDKKTLHKIIQLLNHTGDEMLKLPRVKDGIQASVTLLLTPT